jgi:hypothetical protein
VQREAAEKGADQRGGKKAGPTIAPRSVKGLLKKPAE